MEDEVGKISWSTLLASPGNRRRLRVIIALGFVSRTFASLMSHPSSHSSTMQFSQWSGNGLVSYYINLILEVCIPCFTLLR